MWYTCGHATSYLCASADGRRAAGAESGPALARRLRPAPLPDPARQRPRRAGARGSPSSWAATTRPCATRSTPSTPRGLAALHERLLAPAPSAAAGVPRRRAEQLRALLHRSPRDFGQPTSLWTLDLAAEVSFAQGLTPRGSRRDGPRDAAAPGHPLAAGQALDHQPRPGVRAKKRRRDRLIALAGSAPRLGAGLRGRGVVEPAGPARPARLGRRRTSRCGWWSRRSRRTIPTPRRWPATACLLRRVRAGTKRSGCASSTAARSAP